MKDIGHMFYIAMWGVENTENKLEAHVCIFFELTRDSADHTPNNTNVCIRI